jgi:hypothetical protein
VAAKLTLDQQMERLQSERPECSCGRSRSSLTN